MSPMAKLATGVALLEEIGVLHCLKKWYDNHNDTDQTTP
jgi:hypothetical protein